MQLILVAFFVCLWYTLSCRRCFAFGQKEKLIEKLKGYPKTFTFDDAETLLRYLGYERNNKGRTSGSRVMFTNVDRNTKILLHKPHPRKELLEYQVKQLIEHLEQEGLI